MPVRRDAARYLLDKIPGPFWRKVRKCADQDGISIRALLLQLLADWLSTRER